MHTLGAFGTIATQTDKTVAITSNTYNDGSNRAIANANAHKIELQSGNGAGSDGIFISTAPIVAAGAVQTFANIMSIRPEGITASVAVVHATPTTTLESCILPHGVAPSTPTNGSMWTTTAGLYVRINGVTKTVTLT